MEGDEELDDSRDGGSTSSFAVSGATGGVDGRW